MAMSPSDRAPSSIVRDGRTFNAIGLRVEAGWTDEQGRQYDWAFRLLCEGCGCIGGEALIGDEPDTATARGRVTTDSSGRTFCRACRHQADVLGHDPRQTGAFA